MTITDPAVNFAIPAGLSATGRRAAETIVSLLRAQGRLYAGGCKVFYTPEQWDERGEDYGTDSELIVVYDGGDHRGCFYGDSPDARTMDACLSEAGCYHEPCTGWYGAIYPND